MPVRDLLRVGDRVTFVSVLVNTERRAIRVRSGEVAPGRYTIVVVEDGRSRHAWDLLRVRLRTVWREGVLIACAPCVPVGPESGYPSPAQPTAAPASAPRAPREPEPPDPEEVAFLARLAAESAARRKAAADKVRVEVEQAELVVAQRRAAHAEQVVRIEAARRESEARFAATRTKYTPAERAVLEKHDRTLQAARERAARPRPRRKMVDDTNPQERS